MTSFDRVSFSNQDTELNSYDTATIEAIMPSMFPPSDTSNNKVPLELTPAAMSTQITAINDFYHGIKSPYLNAQELMRKKLVEKRLQLKQCLANMTDLAGKMYLQVLREWKTSIKKVMGLQEVTGLYMANDKTIAQLKIEKEVCQRDIHDLEEGLDWSGKKIHALEEERKNKIGLVSKTYFAATIFRNVVA
jgi:hypothetical protein